MRKFTYLSLISPGPFIGPVEIRGKKNKKKYISFLPPEEKKKLQEGENKYIFFYFFSPGFLLGL